MYILFLHILHVDIFFSKHGHRNFLLLDCRPFIAYNVSHIRGAINVNCCNRFNRKRLQQVMMMIVMMMMMIMMMTPGHRESGGPRHHQGGQGDAEEAELEGDHRVR